MPVEHPYRTSTALAPRPGLTITWPKPGPAVHIFFVAFTALWAAFGIGAYYASKPLWAVMSAVCAAVGIGVYRTVVRSPRSLRADHDGLHWARVAFPGRVIRKTLAPSELAQLFVRDVVDDDEGIISHSYELVARDYGGADHLVFYTRDPEKARWLEARLEQHLGMVDRRIAGDDHH